MKETVTVMASSCVDLYDQLKYSVRGESEDRAMNPNIEQRCVLCRPTNNTALFVVMIWSFNGSKRSRRSTRR